jgi:hypothetical protein
MERNSSYTDYMDFAGVASASVGAEAATVAQEESLSMERQFISFFERNVLPASTNQLVFNETQES